MKSMEMKTTMMKMKKEKMKRMMKKQMAVGVKLKQLLARGCQIRELIPKRRL